MTLANVGLRSQDTIDVDRPNIVAQGNTQQVVLPPEDSDINQCIITNTTDHTISVLPSDGSNIIPAPADSGVLAGPTRRVSRHQYRHEIIESPVSFSLAPAGTAALGRLRHYARIWCVTELRHLF